MSTTLQLPAPASSCTRYCSKHPQERVVGVCSACLADKLSSLIYSSTAFAPEILDNSGVRSPLKNSPPGSIDLPSNLHHPDQDPLQTIDEETESSAQGINNEALLCSTSAEASLTPVEGCAESKLAGNNSVDSKISEEQISLSHDVVHPIEEEKPSIKQDISLISGVGSSIINEEVRPIDVEEGKPKANRYLHANKPIKCKRSKSLCALKGESLIEVEHKAHTYGSAATTKGDQSNTGAKKVTLWTLFQLDDEEKWRNRDLLASETPEAERHTHRFSAAHKPIEEEIDGGSICHAKTIEEAKNVHHDDHTHSHRCVPSASALSSSVCPSMPGKLKHSALLNSLLCRRTGDDKKGSGSTRRPSRVNEASRTISIRNLNEGGLTQVSDDGGFIRATYIASESREALRRCRSKLERSVARSSMSSSQTASPPSLSHGVDMKSERKFNLTARALAAEFPFILQSSAETAEAMVMIPSKLKNFSASATQIEDCKEAQDLRLDDSAAVDVDVPARLQSPTVEAKAALVVLSRPQEVHHLAHNAAVEWEIGEAMENASFSVSSRKAPDDEEVKHAEMPLSSSGVDAAQEVGTAESRDGIPTYITLTEGSEEVPAALGCRLVSRSASCGKTMGAAEQQGTNKLPEEFQKGGGGVWEAYSSKSGKGVRRWPSSSRTGKIAPAQSGLLRFYLTPLRASGRTRFTATRRPPPKRHFWPFIFV